MDVDLKVYCSGPGCGNYMEEKDDVYCDCCVQELKDKISELENKIYDLEKYIEKEEL